MRYPYSVVKRSFHNRESWFNVLVLRYITLPLTYLLVNFTKITPNIISIISLIFGVLSAYYYFLGNVLLGGLIYLVSYIFDAVDGKVMRITKTGKPYGSWMDIAIDRINLTLISMGIAYNYFIVHQDYKILLLNSLFLGLTFIGSESRYHINMYKLNNSIKEVSTDAKSKYNKWCKRNGLIKEPVSLVEILLFYLIVAPQLNIELYSCFIVILFLVLRILRQQLFWIHVNKL